LNAIPGVTDGAFFLCDGASGSTGVERLGAVVVAPALSAAALTEHLRRRIDPVFLPRPLIFVERLPRNATGKLPHRELQRLANPAMHSPIEVPRDHPSFAGHFPKFPVLPGAVLGLVRPGDDLRLEHSAAGKNGTIRFTILAADRTVASGSLSNAVRPDGTA
jgi:hypothetical protein